VAELLEQQLLVGGIMAHSTICTLKTSEDPAILTSIHGDLQASRNPMERIEEKDRTR
jgi:hypothetical protein